MKWDREIERVASRQYGVFSRDQALKAGHSRNSIGRRLANGQWIKVFPRVYRLSGVPKTFQMEVMAALLWAGEEAVASFRTAGALLGFGDVKAARFVEITVPRQREAPDGIRLHTCDDLANCDRARLGPLRLTTVARTLIDLGAVLDRNAVEMALEDALRRRLTSIEQLNRRIADLNCQGRKGPAILKGILERRYPGNWTSGSNFEIKILQVIRKHSLPLPVPQYEIRDDGGLVARIDYAYPDAMLILECESYENHSDRVPWYRDVHRYNAVASLGYRVLRATPEDVADPAQLIKDLSGAKVRIGPRDVPQGTSRPQH